MAAHRKDYDLAVEMYNGGKSVGQIAQLYHVRRNSMYNILLRRGVRFRSQLRYGPDNHFYRGGARRNVNIVIQKGLRQGRISVQPCEVCGKRPQIRNGRQIIQAHHDDYNYPLKVRWLCKQHHHEWHIHNAPIPRTRPVTPHTEIASMGGKASWLKHRENNLKMLSRARQIKLGKCA